MSIVKVKMGEKERNLCKELEKEEVIKRFNLDNSVAMVEFASEEQELVIGDNGSDSMDLFSIILDYEGAEFRCEVWDDSIGFWDDIDIYMSLENIAESNRVKFKRKYIDWIEKCLKELSTLGHKKPYVIWKNEFDSGHDQYPIDLEEFKNIVNS